MNLIVLVNTPVSTVSVLLYVQQTVAVVVQMLNVTESTIKLYVNAHQEELEIHK